MGFASIEKCGQGSIHLRAKDTGKQFIKSMTCNTLECPKCRSGKIDMIKKKVKYYASHERLLFFNTLTSKNGFDDLDHIWESIRVFMTNFSVEWYMSNKGYDERKARRWYHNKRKEMIKEDFNIELGKISKVQAIIELARQKNILYKNLAEDDKKEFRLINQKWLKAKERRFQRLNLKNKVLVKTLITKIISRFRENENNKFKFILVVEFHKNGNPHYHILTNKYLPHCVIKKYTRENVSEIYDNTYLKDYAKERYGKEDFDTDDVARYCTKLTEYLTKDSVDTYIDLKSEKKTSKRLITASKGINILSESDDERNFQVINKFFNIKLNANRYEVPEEYFDDNRAILDFLQERSVYYSDDLSVGLRNAVDGIKFPSLDEEHQDYAKYNLIVSERIKHINEYSNVPDLNYVSEPKDLDSNQVKAIESFRVNPITLLVGRAGTGKSFTISKLLDSLRPDPEETLICTYTGKASSRLRELFNENGLKGYRPTTIHMACSSDFGNKFLRNETNNLMVKYVIIDEISMLSKEILSKLYMALPTNVKILMAGDIGQLPPVNDVAAIPDFINSREINSIELMKVYRSDDKVLSVAEKVRSGKLIDSYFYSDDELKGLVLDYVKQGYQILSNTNQMVKTINMIVQEEKQQIKKVFNEDYYYNLGDRVMITANHYGKDVSNGDTGVICDFDDKGITIKLDNEERAVYYRYDQTVSIVPAYCMTVHKSQGSEYKKVAVILSEQENLNTRNLLYTAITRAKEDVKIHVPNEKVLSNCINKIAQTDIDLNLNNVYQYFQIA